MGEGSSNRRRRRRRRTKGPEVNGGNCEFEFGKSFVHEMELELTELWCEM